MGLRRVRQAGSVISVLSVVICVGLCAGLAHANGPATPAPHVAKAVAEIRITWLAIVDNAAYGSERGACARMGPSPVALLEHNFVPRPKSCLAALRDYRRALAHPAKYNPCGPAPFTRKQIEPSSKVAVRYLKVAVNSATEAHTNAAVNGVTAQFDAGPETWKLERRGWVIVGGQPPLFFPQC